MKGSLLQLPLSSGITGYVWAVGPFAGSFFLTISAFYSIPLARCSPARNVMRDFIIFGSLRGLNLLPHVWCLIFGDSTFKHSLKIYVQTYRAAYAIYRYSDTIQDCFQRDQYSFYLNKNNEEYFPVTCLIGKKNL